MSKKLKLLSLVVGAVSSLQMILPISVFAEDPKEQNENNVASETTQDFSIPGVDEQNVNQLNEDGYAPLHLQIQEDNLGTVKFLISKGADISLKDKNGDTPLHTAAREDAIACLIYLISKGADVEAKNSQGETPLMLAAKAGNRLSFSALLGDWLKEKRANINAVDDSNNTILHCLAGSWMGQLDSLLQHICHCSEEDPCASLCEMINRKNNAGETPLFNAIRSKNEELAMFLIKNGAIDVSNNNGQTALMLAAQNGLKGLVRELVKKGSKVDAVDNEGNTLLHFMARDWDSSLSNVFSDPDNVKFVDNPFLQLREMINVENKKGETPLFVTAENDQSELAELIIKNGANINYTLWGKTTLHLAVEKNCINIVKLLLEKGASPNNYNIWNAPILHLAVEKNFIDIVRLLIEHGANVNYSCRRPPLHCAVLNNSIDMVRLLLEKGVDVNAKDPFGGKTPLHLAVERNFVDIVKLLLEKGANANEKNLLKETSLHLVAQENTSFEVAKLMIENGAELGEREINLIKKYHMIMQLLCEIGKWPG